MGETIPPAIVRTMNEGDRCAVEVVSTPYNGVSFTPGWGDSGYRVEVVEYECPECGFDRMIRRVDVNPEFPSEVRYWCLNPNCPHFVRTELSHDCHGSYPQRGVVGPKVMEEHARNP